MFHWNIFFYLLLLVSLTILIAVPFVVHEHRLHEYSENAARIKAKAFEGYTSL